MPSLPLSFRALLAVGVLLLCGPAEARFGKRSPSTPSSGSGDAVHDASPVGSDGASASSTSESSDASESSREEGASEEVDPGRTGQALLDLFLFLTDVVEHVPDAPPPPVVDEAGVERGPPMYSYAEEARLRARAEPRSASVEARSAPAEPRRALMVRAGGEGMAVGRGSAAALRASIEGEWMGVDGEVTSMVLPTDDGTPGTDDLRLFSAHLSLAVFADDQTRLRVHAGVAGVTAPDLSDVGPSLAVSFERCLMGALDVEGRGQLVPMDYLQVDAQAGLAAHLGPLMVRGGWRWLMLDDQGLVDGVAHRDTFSGPYAGAGLYF